MAEAIPELMRLAVASAVFEGILQSASGLLQDDPAQNGAPDFSQMLARYGKPRGRLCLPVGAHLLLDPLGGPERDEVYQIRLQGAEQAIEPGKGNAFPLRDFCPAPARQGHDTEIPPLGPGLHRPFSAPSRGSRTRTPGRRGPTASGATRSIWDALRR